MKSEELLSNKDFAKCVEFHGHICPGLSIGFQAAKNSYGKVRCPEGTR